MILLLFSINIIFYFKKVRRENMLQSFLSYLGFVWGSSINYFSLSNNHTSTFPSLFILQDYTQILILLWFISSFPSDIVNSSSVK